jgi:hypothetical protein
MRRSLGIGVLSAAIAVAFALAGPAAAAEKAPRMTVIGDSVQASFGYAPKAVRRLGKGFDLRLDARVCRRLVTPSCSFNGSTPQTALQLIKSRRGALGSVVVINVGYNEGSAGYDVNAVMRALRAAGVDHVVWVTLRETRALYRSINGSIRQADPRWKAMTIADWNAVSAGKPWFGSDGLHLNASGAYALSGLLRQKVLAAL